MLSKEKKDSLQTLTKKMSAMTEKGIIQLKGNLLHEGVDVKTYLFRGFLFRLAPVKMQAKGIFLELRGRFKKGKHTPLIFAVETYAGIYLVLNSVFDEHEFTSYTIEKYGVPTRVTKDDILLSLKRIQKSMNETVACTKCSKKFLSDSDRISFCASECLNDEPKQEILRISTDLSPVLSDYELEAFPDGLPDGEIPDFQDFLIIDGQRHTRCSKFLATGDRKGRRCIHPGMPGKVYCGDHNSGGDFMLQKIHQTGLDDADDARAVEEFVSQIKKDHPLVVTKPSMMYHLRMLAKIHITILKAPGTLRNAHAFQKLIDVYNQLMEKLGITGEQSMKYRTKQQYEEIESMLMAMQEIIETVVIPCDRCRPLVERDLMNLKAQSNATRNPIPT